MKCKLRNDNVLIVEDARLLFPNFSGRESKYNAAGNRNFGVVIDPELGQKLKGDGWNVRILAPRDEDDDATCWIPVSVSYKYRPPKIVVFTSKNSVNLDEENVGSIDYADIARIKLSVNPSYWENNGRSGIKAYLRTMHVFLEEDDFAEDFEDAPSPEDVERKLNDFTNEPLPFN